MSEQAVVVEYGRVVRATRAAWVAGMLTLLCAFLLMGGPCVGQAYGATLSGAQLVGFGDTYAVAGSLLTHRGVDIEMSAGSLVECLGKGRVHFAGTVPSPSGGTVGAVTIEDADGRLWSYLPLESLSVAKGEIVRDQDCLGHLAQEGDPSSGAPHLHLGLRVDGEYMDPAPVLGLAPPSENPAIGTETEADVHEEVAASPVADSARVAEVASPVDVEAAVSPDVVGSVVPESGGQELADGVDDPSRSADPVRRPLSETGEALMLTHGSQALVADTIRTSTAVVGATVALALVTGLGIAVGVTRALQERASRRVCIDHGSTRLQPR